MKRQKLIALIMALVLVVGMLAGCSGKTDDSTPKSDTSTDTPNSGGKTQDTAVGTAAGSGEAAKADTEVTEDKKAELIASHTDENGKTFITTSITDDPGSMFPQGSGSSKPRQVVLDYVFEGMFQIQGTGGELVPQLAEGYEVLEDGYTYRITLKDYVYDSEGNHFTANDVKYVLDVVAREYNLAYANYLDAVNVQSEYVVDLVYNTKMYNYIVNSLIAQMWTQAAYEASPDQMTTTPVGTGPYVLTSWTSGAELVFEARDDYWETDKSKIVRNSYANVDKIISKVIKDSAQRVIALESGELDMCTGVSATDLAFFTDNENYNVFNALQDQVVSIFFNCSENSPLQDVNIRQAIAYAIDAEGVLNGVDQGNGVVCKTAFCHIFPDFDEKWNDEDYYGYDPDKATELLKEAGYDANNRLSIKIMFENNDRLANVATVIQGYLLNVNVDLEIFPCDGALFNTYKLDNTQSDLLMATCGSSTFGSSSLIGNLRSIAPDKTLIGIQEDTLWEKITIMAENAYEDWSYAHDLHYYVKDNCYLYCLYSPINFIVTSPVVTGLILNAKGMDSPNCCTFIWNE